MSASALYMSMSLDGFIPSPMRDRAMDSGTGGRRLHEWASTGADAGEIDVVRPAGGHGEVLDEMMSMGPVVA